MLGIRKSQAKTRSNAVKEAARRNGEGNLVWCKRQRGAHDGPCLVLLGGMDAMSLRLRVAQSHARHDLTPSRWSHVVLFPSATALEKRRAGAEISLQPAEGFGFPAPTNAVQRASLAAYDDPGAFPNVALLHVPVATVQVKESLDLFQGQRAALDAVDLLVRWLPFVWGAGSGLNPLLEGVGIPSAAMAQVVLGAAGYEVTPGTSSRSSSPEAIWQAARWWHEYPRDSDKPKPLTGAYVAPHVLVP